MEENDTPLFSSYISDFKAGDLVYWVTFDHDEGYNVIHNIRHGAVIEIIKKTFGFDTREVYYACVLPFDGAQTVELALHLLRKTN